MREKLGHEIGGSERRHLGVVSEVDKPTVGVLPVVALPAHPVGDGVVIGQYGATTTRRAQHLCWIEAEARGQTQRPRSPASASGSEGLGGILDEDQSMFAGESLDPVGVAHVTEEMGMDDGAGPLGYQIGSIVEIHVEVGADVSEDRHRSHPEDR